MYYSKSFEKSKYFTKNFSPDIFLGYNVGMPFLEAVPNVSEGKNSAVLRALEDLLRAAPRVRFLGADANAAANRTVFTLAGEPGAVADSLFDFIALSCRLIDMRTQHGTHPRLGAADVCPLVPLKDISLAECARLARRLGRRVGTELGVPVYLYEAAAETPQRKNLAFIRKGEYEGLREKLRTLPPDFGPAQWTETAAKSGACVIGARNILIAFNINLNTQDPAPAKIIAAKIRESSGGLKGVKAIGWYMGNFARAQVSCNITDFRAAPLHAVYESCQQEAAALGLKATGCELVGLAPLEALLAAGRHYAPRETREDALISAAVRGLHLTEVKPFDPREQILEYKAGFRKSVF